MISKIYISVPDVHFCLRNLQTDKMLSFVAFPLGLHCTSNKIVNL